MMPSEEPRSSVRKDARARLVRGLALSIGMLASCRVYVAPVPQSKGAGAPRAIASGEKGTLLAGVADVDITPAPGLSLFGHGPEGRPSTGTLLRLHCQAFYFEYTPDDGAATETLALVPCDLAAPSLLLQRRVAERVAKSFPFGADRLVMPATHTHAGPAHYFGGADYAGLLSTQAPGYSDLVTDYLATRIADAIVRAHASAVEKDKPHACIAWAEGSIHDRSHRIPRFGKNRSMEAFAANTLTREEEQRFTGTDRPAEDAVDGTLSVLRVDRCDKDGHSVDHLGAFAVYGVHPTALPNTNELYHGDVFGYAVRESVAEFTDRFPCPEDDPKHHELAPKPCFVVGLANGISGDVSPIIDFQGPREARRLGSSLAKEVMKLWHAAEPALVTDAPLRVAYRELRLPGARVETVNPFYEALRRDVYAYPGEGSRCGSIVPLEPAAPHVDACDPRLCDEALLGTAFAGGAEDGRTFFYELPQAREGAIAVSSSTCHAPKLELHKPFASAEYDFPRIAPISILYLGGRIVSTFPSEVTTLAGHRARTQLERWLTANGHPDLGRVIQVTLTNEYLQYVTTREEYEKQQYEGASDLYGPDSARFYGNQQLCLARFLFGDVDFASDSECTLGQPLPGLVEPVRFRPGQEKAAHPSDACSPSGSGLFVLVTQADQAFCQKADTSRCSPDVKPFERDGEQGWTVRWTPPADCSAPWAEPRVRIVAEDGGEIATDQGDGIEVRRVEREWRISWLPNARELSRAAGRRFHFELTLEPTETASKAPPHAPHIERSEPIDPGCH